jgi:YggT family protein
MYMFIRIFDLLITVINTLILIRVILSWLAPGSANGFTELVYNLTTYSETL